MVSFWGSKVVSEDYEKELDFKHKGCNHKMFNIVFNIKKPYKFFIPFPKSVNNAFIQCQKCDFMGKLDGGSELDILYKKIKNGEEFQFNIDVQKLNEKPEEIKNVEQSKEVETVEQSKETKKAKPQKKRKKSKKSKQE